ncbi:teneurin-4-like [Saccostrea echinata]|uniref:teneurin-4-like n=1 Tax=Saccostrea echinata TaxID=191078 RepID=UPI002A80A62D|nr:teneurin-4-like [Saccostrea echinata]
MILLTAQFLLFIIYAQAYENLALRKPAWQAHNWPDEGYDKAWGASKAVDGHYSDRSAPGNHCTISEGMPTATLRVDLGRVSSINHVNIYYRTDNAPSPGAYFDRFAGFFLYVSNYTQKERGKLCFHEIQNVNGTPLENKTINCLVHGRYVIYYNERKWNVTYPKYYSKKAFNEVCELQVFGCNDSRKYGVNCDQECSKRCQEERCYTTGDCLSCIPGYLGHQCNRPCDDQTYGLGCSLSCGNCSKGETCHHVNGTCMTGCNEGAKGQKCKIPCNPGYYGKDCVQKCNVNCGVSRRCDRFTGECEGGCQPGWRGTLCDKPPSP